VHISRFEKENMIVLMLIICLSSIHPEKIMRSAIHETLSGRLWVKQQTQVKVNTIKHETQVNEETT
jgi:hypothetical protein